MNAKNANSKTGSEGTVGFDSQLPNYQLTRLPNCRIGQAASVTTRTQSSERLA
jgi:hypothetical protein